MKKILLIFILLFVGVSTIFSGSIPTPKPDEGMWLPLFIEKLNYDDMQKIGLKLTAEEIYSVNNSSLKDAIVIFGGGCTGEIVSSEGLLLTNHHCGYGQIQYHSSTEHDYLKNGFWAKNREEELINPGLSVKFLVRMEDVSSIVLSETNPGMSETERNKFISAAVLKIETEASLGGKLVANVKSFFGGNEFYLLVYEEYKDVRLVGAPPSSIGKFGADTDNWMWPRHTGDFSMFRVYTNPDGKPAVYSKENIPLKPKKFLKVSLKGTNEGDFSMIMGNPGRTDRYLTSYGVQAALDLKNPTIVAIRTKKLAIMKEDMDLSDAVRIQYASKYAQTANYWKYYQGQSKGLIRLDVLNQKLAQEQEFQKWLQTKDEYIRKYGNILSDIDASYKVINQYEIFRQYISEAIFRGSDIVSFAASYRQLYLLLKEPVVDNDKVKKTSDLLKAGLDKFFKDYNLPTDKKLFNAMISMFYEKVGKDQHPSIMPSIYAKYKGDFNKYTEYVYSKSIFPSREKIESLLAAPSLKVLEKDPLMILINSFLDLHTSFNEKTKEAQEKINVSNRLYIAGLREMNKNKKYYPDANFTMRLTYGKVLAYKPADATSFNFYTTLDGVMEKEDPTNAEFVVPEKLKTLYNNKDFGQYGDVNSKGERIMKVCFLTNHDITGGNSGSPVLDGEGNLIGLAFDGNWEGLSGDIAYEPDMQRTINVDIRYVMFIVDKFAGATNLIEEMTFVK